MVVLLSNESVALTLDHSVKLAQLVLSKAGSAYPGVYLEFYTGFLVAQE